VRLTSCLFLSCLLVAACKVTPPDDNKPQPDAGPSGLRTPRANAPERTPLDTVAVRGRADGATRVVVKDADTHAAVVSPLLPGGDFCVHVALPPSSTSNLLVYGVAENGEISPPASLQVVHDLNSPQPADPTCTSGGCEEEEVCGSGIDDDCNGFRDDCDPACNGCVDDYLEPNDTPFSVPMVSPGTYQDLMICPCREDWFAFLVGENGRIKATATFTHSQIDIDLKLYRAADAEMHMDTPVASSTGTANTETIDYLSTGPGAYYLRVFSFRADGQGSYTLRIE
jgi:hypothetical protein